MTHRMLIKKQVLKQIFEVQKLENDSICNDYNEIEAAASHKSSTTEKKRL